MSKIINKFSVVCPLFNFETFIDQLCDTIIAQDIHIFETIFVDDGSTDQTINKLKKYEIKFKNKKIQMKIISINHSGPGYARNVGIDNTSGNWIAFLDADDTWKKDKLSKVNQIINENKKINTILHYEYFFINNEAHGVLSHGNKFTNYDNLSKSLYINNFFSTSAIVINKELLKNNKFDISLPNAQDFDLWLKLSDKINLHIIKYPLGTYNLNKKSISSKSYLKRIKSLLIVYYRHRKLVRFHVFIYKIIRTLISRQWFLDIIKIFK